jgi:hypothetical protein
MLVAQSGNILKQVQLYIKKGQVLWYINYTAIKLISTTTKELSVYLCLTSIPAHRSFFLNYPLMAACNVCSSLLLSPFLPSPVFSLSHVLITSPFTSPFNSQKELIFKYFILIEIIFIYA